MLTKIHAYGFDKISLTFIYTYLSQWKQKTKVGSNFSELMVILRSILGPLLFIIYICLFIFACFTFAFIIYSLWFIYVYYQRSFGVWKLCGWPLLCLWVKFWLNTGWIRKTYGWEFWMVSTWFSKANAKKVHLFLNPSVDKTINIENFIIKSSNAEVFLGATIDGNLSFNEHVTYLCATANRKLDALSRASKFMSLKKRRILMKSFIISQFSYCPLIWMTYSRWLNNKINHIYERALRIVYKDFSTFFEGLLAQDKSVTIHNRNLQQLAVEIFKVKIGIPQLLTK